MKKLFVIVIFCVVYALSLLMKDFYLKQKGSEDIPIIYEIHEKNGLPVDTQKAEIRAISQFQVVTGMASDLDTLVFYLSSKDAFKVKIGAKIILQTSNSSLNGVVVKKTDRPNLLSGLYEFQASFVNSNLEKKNYVASVEVGNLKSVLTVPREAVSSRGNVHHAFVVENEKLVRRNVEVKEGNSLYWIVVSGLKHGENVVVSDLRDLTPGTLVKVVRKEGELK